MNEWAGSLPGLLAMVWQRLEAAAAAREGGLRLATLATAGRDGAPQARSLVLRRADRAARTVTLLTDARSTKVAELAAEPRAALLVWDEANALQIRLALEVRVLTGAAAAPQWREVPAASRGNYGTLPAPGTPIAGPEDYAREPDPARLAVLRGQVLGIDAVVLSTEPHRRAVYSHADGWAGSWRAP